MYEYKAELIKIVDADTMHLEVDLGLDIHTFITIRVADINAPEMSTTEGQIATKWVLDNLPKSVIIKTTKDKKEKYGRYLADIFWTDDTGTTYNLSEELLKRNLAVVYK